MTQDSASVNEQNNKVALIYMLIAVLLFSTLPFVFAFGNASSAPFFFVATVHFSSTFCTAVFLAWWHLTKRKHQGAKETLKIMYKKIYTFPFLVVVIARSDYILFALALLYIDVAIGTILVEIWPFFMIVITAMLFKKDGRYNKITPEDWALLGLAFIGCGFAVASQSENAGDIIVDLTQPYAIIGVLLVLFSAFLNGATSPYSLQIGRDSSKESKGGMGDELFFTMAAMGKGRIISAVLFLIIGYSAGESFSEISVTTAVLYGLFGTGIATIFLRLANLKTTNLSINALSYATPVMALVWLGFASLLVVPHLDWLIIGIIAIVTANLLLNFKADKRLAYKALVVSLWVCGSVIYLTDGFEFAGSLEVAATIFILILSFRVDRLIRRTTEEENVLLALFQQLRLLVDDKKIPANSLAYLLQIDTNNSTRKLEKPYNALKIELAQATQVAKESGASKDDMKALSDIEGQVDVLAHSKQQGVHFGEMVAIGLINLVFVGGLLFFNHAVNDAYDLFANASSMILASVTVFLFFNIFDLENDRQNPVLVDPVQKRMNDINEENKELLNELPKEIQEEIHEYKTVKENAVELVRKLRGIDQKYLKLLDDTSYASLYHNTIVYPVKFTDTANRKVPIVVASIVSVIIIATYIVLFWLKAGG